MSIHDETWDRTVCPHCKLQILHGEKSLHLNGACVDLLLRRPPSAKVKSFSALAKHLVSKNNFKHLAPCTFLYQDGVDVITVFVQHNKGEPVLVTITGDGSLVTPSITTIKEDKTDWDKILQAILDKF